MNLEIGTLTERLEQLERSNAALERWNGETERRCTASETTYARLNRRLRVACGLGLAGLIVALFASPATRAAAQSGYGATIQALIDKTQYITVADGQMYIRNTNLWIQNGLGATNGNPADPIFGVPVLNGKGNLIVGYNLTRVGFGGTDLRTGSHNLIVGDRQNFSSFGGLVAGTINTITGPYASVSGGDSNTASGFYSSVSGGADCTAMGHHSSVSGGFANQATGFIATVSGGEFNTASGDRSSVSGGFNHNQGGQSVWQGGTLVSGP
jgi:hypothetical protein